MSTDRQDTFAMQAQTTLTDRRVLHFYEALERASNDMLAAACVVDWEPVVTPEGSFVLLIAQLKHAATEAALPADEHKQKTRIMQRILVNDAEIRTLAEPWLDDLEQTMSGRARTLH
jgi:flagellar protein FliT